MKSLEKLTKKELIKLITEIRPKADAYDKVSQELGIKNNIIGEFKKINIPDVVIEMFTKIDEILASYEDWMHGDDGDKCTYARKLIRKLQQQVKLSTIPDVNDIESHIRIERNENKKYSFVLINNNDVSKGEEIILSNKQRNDIEKVLTISDVNEDKNYFTMIFGDNNTIFEKFNTEDLEDIEFLYKNDGKVKISTIGFAEEWEELVDYEKSYAYIDNGKLYVILYGLPEYLNKNLVEKYFKKTLKQYIKEEYGEFFETNPGCPICMVVKQNDIKVIV